MYKNFKILSLVVARAGSKGLKNKNIKRFSGKPLVSWSILASKKSKYIDYTLVSTDSKKIIRISKSLGVNAPFTRPKVLASDKSSIKDVIYHSLKWLKKNKLKFDFLILLQATSPLRTSKHIDNSIKYYFKHSKKNIDTMISLTKVPIKTSWLMETKGIYTKFALNKYKNNKLFRRQNLQQYFIPNGAIYFANIDKFSGNFFTKNTIYYEMEKKVSLDIDDIQDFNKSVR